MANEPKKSEPSKHPVNPEQASAAVIHGTKVRKLTAAQMKKVSGGTGLPKPIVRRGPMTTG